MTKEKSIENGAQGISRDCDNQVVQVDVRTLIPSPENEQLYRERSTRDSDYKRLLESVKQHGVQAPLLVSLDNYIISGHQRCQAAIDAGLYMVPVLFLNLRRTDYDANGWLALLREHNTGREKSFEELVREKLVDIDPQKAIKHIIDDRVERSVSQLATISIGKKGIKRYGISPEKRGMADAILSVLADMKDYLPISLRAIHYRLFVKAFFRNTKTQLRYTNEQNSYKDLSSLATRMRIYGEIPWDWICDETRQVTEWQGWRNAADFIARKCENFLCGYSRNLLQSQTQHFENVVEKLTVKNFVEPVAANYGMPVVIMRGNSGIDARYQIKERYLASGKRSLFLLCLGDCDPDGDNIVKSTLKSLKYDFHLSNVRGVRVAMTHDQADELHLPRSLEANPDSSNYQKFISEHDRSDCYELEAVAPEVLQEWLDEAIRGVIDIEAYNHEVEQQEKEASEIMARREAVLEVMKNGTSD
jgi:ParB-like chromosome segregation protein Spo0J